MGSNTPDNYLDEPPDELDYTKEEWQSLNYNQQYYRAEDERREYIKEQSRKNKQRNRDWYNSVKKSENCKNCGENRAAALVFHHISDKSGNVARLVSQEYGIETIAKEIEKCVILCSNCHRVHHNGKENLNIEELELGADLAKEALNQKT